MSDPPATLLGLDTVNYTGATDYYREATLYGHDSLKTVLGGMFAPVSENK